MGRRHVAVGDARLCLQDAKRGGRKLRGYDSYLVVTGIAKPAPIFKYLKEQSIKFDSITFGDHHNFSTKEIKQIAKKSNLYKGIITTEKDWMRLKETKLKKLCSVEIFRLQIGIHFLEDKDKLAFEKQINRLLK